MTAISRGDIILKFAKNAVFYRQRGLFAVHVEKEGGNGVKILRHLNPPKNESHLAVLQIAIEAARRS
jgi:hypothetical protein